MVVHASRSRYESFLKCPRFGYIQYHWAGKGIVKAGKNIFLSTGIWLHKGLELIGKKVQKQNKLAQQELEIIIQDVRDGYFKDLFPQGWEDNGGGFDLSLETLDELTGERRELSKHELHQIQQYTFNEQTALIEALLRVFYLRVLPIWLAKYKIAAIELDMAFPLVKGEGFEVIQSARIDWVLQEIESKDLFLVSFKGYRTFGNHEAKVAGVDTQGLSESWAFDEYLRSKNIPRRIMGVKMVYFIKGARKETKRGNSIYEQNSPLIRGYRRLTEDGPEYAHSWYYPDTREEDQRNDSGVRALGKSWDKIEFFNGAGFEEIGGIKGWIELLQAGGIQEECGDILEQHVVEPEVYLRHEQDIAEWLYETISREKEIALKLVEGEGLEAGSEDHRVFMAKHFPKNRQACFYYPGEANQCQYLSICHGTEEERAKPLENGFVFRTPHHKAELIQIGKSNGRAPS